MARNPSLRLLSSNIKLSTSRSTSGKRSVHLRRALLYPAEHGVGNFLPTQALKTSLEWQDGLLERLNDEVKGTADEHTSVVQTVINTAAHREKRLAFNYASLALNNSYFLDNIKPPPAHDDNHEQEIGPDLLNAISKQHGSLRQLKSSFSAAALGMFSNGWVWLVSDSRGATGILPTFGPGTLLVRSQKYMALEQGANLGDVYRSADGTQPVSSPIPKSLLPGVAPSFPTFGLSSSHSPRPPHEPGTRSLHTSLPLLQNEWDLRNKASMYKTSATTEPVSMPNILNVGEVLFPLLCVPVYEHAWMSAGFGVWGKEKWLQEFWSVVDWAKVTKAYANAKSTKTFT